MYDDNALQTLQQILFFKELGFPLKEIKQILDKPDFDRIAAFKKQKELFLLKRNRLDRLIQLLDRLEKGEQCMSFKEFDLSDYINALEDFKSNQAETVIQHWGSIENFDMFIQKIRDDEYQVAKLAIQQFGSIEKYNEAMKHNLEHFSEIMDTQISEDAKKVAQQTDKFYGELTSDLSRDISSPEVQSLVHSLIMLIQENGGAVSLDKPYIHVLIDA
ncbi:MAG: MerR family DNA-binding protein, partial [Lachnospiraceae bacterium]